MEARNVTWKPLAVLCAFLALLAVVPSDRAIAVSGSPVTIATLPTYRAAESLAVAVSSSTGDIAELRGVAGHVGRVKRITIAKPSVAFTLTIVKRSTQDSSGTATTPAAVSMDTSFNSAATLTCQGYTAKPTAGTTTGKVYPPISIGTGDVLTIEFGQEDKQAFAIRSGESLALVTDTGTTVGYMVEWTEGAN